MAITVGVVGAGATIAGGLIGGNAAKKAGEQQAAAAQQAVDFQKQVYGTEQTNLQPYIGTGTNALGSVAQLYGLAPPGSGGGGNALDAYKAYQSTPFYQFPLQQGQKTLESSGAARGLTLSGGQSNALQAYGQGYASQNFGNYIQGLTSLANLGATTSEQLGNAGNNAAQTVLGGQKAVGAGQAAGTVGQANGLNNALKGLAPLASALGGIGGDSTGQGSSYVDSNSSTF